MNVEQALHHAKESNVVGLNGLYPTCAQVLSEEVLALRGEVVAWKQLVQELFNDCGENIEAHLYDRVKIKLNERDEPK